jgi:hypothetical protein
MIPYLPFNENFACFANDFMERNDSVKADTTQSR